MENVPGLAKGLGKAMFEEIVEKLHKLGYETVCEVVDTADYGVPQRRKRLVLIGTNNHKVKLTFPKRTNHNPETSDDQSASWNTVRNTIEDLPELKAGEISKEDPMHKASNLAEINLQRMSLTPHDGGGRLSWPEELVLECHKKVSGYKDIYGRMKWDAPSPTITGGCVMISKGRFGHPEQDRAISLREAARLQTFPDDYQFAGNTGEIARQLGNAVPPLLAKRIADALLSFIQESKRIENHVSESNEADNSMVGVFFQEA
jgi:DNA (cytosine-5)-methyltransferase 1